MSTCTNLFPIINLYRVCSASFLFFRLFSLPFESFCNVDNCKETVIYGVQLAKPVVCGFESILKRSPSTHSTSFLLVPKEGGACTCDTDPFLASFFWDKGGYHR